MIIIDIKNIYLISIFSDHARKWMSVNTLNGLKHVIHFKMNEYNIKLNINVYGDIDNEHFIILISKCITLIFNK